MFIGAFILEFVIFRNLIILGLAALRWYLGGKRGYEFLDFKKENEAKEIMQEVL